MLDIDPKAKERAAKLLKDARNNTYGSSTKRVWKFLQNTSSSIGKSRTGWKENRSLSGMGAETVIRSALTYGGLAAGTALAGAIGSATLLASVASFGIVPALAGLAGYLAKSGISEFKYQSSSKKLKKAVKNGGSIGPELIVPAMLKIIRKYDRVKTRAKQVAGGGSKYQKLRHLGVAIRGWKRRGKHPSVLVKDTLLDERLLELRYYGQMLFNTVGGIIEASVKARDQYADVLNRLYIYTIRQVHFSGNHENCKSGRCYGMPIEEYEQKVKVHGRNRKWLYSNQISKHQIQEFQSSQKKIYHSQKGQDPKLILKRLQHIANIDTDSETDEDITTNKTKLTLEGVKLVGQSSGGDGISSQVVKTTKEVGTKINWKSFSFKQALDVSKNTVTKGAKESGKTVQYTVGAITRPAMIAVDVLFEEAMKIKQNRMTRKKIFKGKESVLGLIELVNDAEAQASDELEELCRNTGKSFRTHSVRVAQKVIHYCIKIGELDTQVKALLQTMHNWKGKESPFKSCEEAWEFNQSFQYVFKNYNKFITHMVFLEGLLLSMDLKVSERVSGISQGTIVKEGAKVIKPVYLSLRHGDKTVGKYSKSNNLVDDDDDDDDDDD